MDITISTHKASTFFTTYGKRLLVAAFSVGWLVPFAFVFMIPVDVMKWDLESTQREMDATNRYTFAATKQKTDVETSNLDSLKREMEFAKAWQARRPEAQLQRLQAFQTAVLISCVWLALVIVFWVWKLYPTLSPQRASHRPVVEPQLS